jgi:hypothetical protein
VRRSNFVSVGHPIGIETGLDADLVLYSQVTRLVSEKNTIIFFTRHGSAPVRSSYMNMFHCVFFYYYLSQIFSLFM